MNKKAIIIISSVVVLLLIIVFSIGKDDKIVLSSNPVPSTIKSDKPTLKVFVENSGSMDGYMCEGSQLKDAVYAYVSDLNRYSDTTKLYYINSQIIPYNDNLSSYIKDLNPTSFRNAGGNTSSTDFGNILASVLSTVQAKTVAILISDCILDLPVDDPKKFLSSCEIQIKEEVIEASKRVPDMGVEILKLYSDFSGKYYYASETPEVLKDVKRPYYMWIIGDKNYLAKLNDEVPISLLSKYGLSNMVSFSNHSQIPFEITNSSLTGNTIKPIKGVSKAVILADFRSTLQPNEIIQNNKLYSSQDPGIVVESINPITKPNSKYTHFLTLTIPKGIHNRQECLTLNLPTSLAAWIDASNDETGQNIRDNLTKTTGIKYLIQGVADAFRDSDTIVSFNYNIR